MHSLTENIDFFDLLEFFNLHQKEYDRLEESYNDYPTDIFYDLIYGHIKINEKKFSDITFTDNYDIEELCRSIFYEGSKEEDLKERFLEAIDTFIEDEVLPCFDDEDIHFNFKMLDYKTVQMNVTVKDPDYYLSRGMNAWGMFDWKEHCESDKESLRKPYYLLRECLHYYEACNSKSKLSIKFDWDNMWTFTEDGESLFEAILKKWKEGNIHGNLIITNPELNGRSYTIREARELMPMDEIPEEYDDCKVYMIYRKER